MSHLSRIVGLAVALVVYSSTAHAAPTASERSVAVPLVIEGRARFEAQQYAAALELFKRAHEIAKAPTTGLDLAKTYEALGQLIEARKLAVEVANSPIEPNEKPAFADARADAKMAIEALDSRIPFLRVHVVGPPQSVARVSIDGKTLTAEEAGKPYAANPGKHTIVVDAPEYHASEVSVALVESETMPVELKLNPKDKKPQPPKPTPNTNTSSRLAPEAKIGFVVAGGLAAVAIGTGIGAMVTYGPTRDAFVAKDTPTYEDHRHTLEGLAWTATISGALAVGALAYAVTRPRNTLPSNNAPKVGLMVAPTVAGMAISGTW